MDKYKELFYKSQAGMADAMIAMICASKHRK